MGKIETASRKNRGMVIQLHLLSTIDKKCQQCQKFFEPKTSKSKFCSDRCIEKYCHKKTPKKREIRVCIVCGNEYDCIKASKSMTCSNKCGHKSIALKKSYLVSVSV